jgi:hypothetical protein
MLVGREGMARNARTRNPRTPIARELPPGLAATVGRIIARHSYLDWLLANILYALLSIPIKQGRVAIKIPPPPLYVRTVSDLLAFLRLHLAFNLEALERKLVAAEQARNILCHSVFTRDARSGKIHIELVSGAWDEAEDVEAARKNIRSESLAVTRAFLAGKRAAIEDAIEATRHFAGRVNDGLQALNEIRRTRRTMDRRNAR